MRSNGHSGRCSVFQERLKRAVTNTTFQWFLGLLVTTVGVIITLLSYMEDRGAEKEHLPPIEYTVPQQYTVIEHQSLFVQEAQTNFSVIFQNFEGQEFVSLNISPVGKESSVRPVLRGYTEEFSSSVGVFNVQILDIDYGNRKVDIQVSQKE